MLTTSILGKVMPDFVEEFGPDRRIDLNFTDFHQVFTEGKPDAKPSNFAINEKGLLKLTYRGVIQLDVEGQSGKWETARKLYLTTVVKGRVEVQDQQLVLTLKNAEISDLVMLKNGEQVQ